MTVYVCSICNESFNNRNILANHVRWAHKEIQQKGKYQLYCCCIICRAEITVQNIKSHYNKCHNLNKSIKLCEECNKECKPKNKFCSNSCAAKFNNRKRDASIKRGPSKFVGPTQPKERPYKQCIICNCLHNRFGKTCSNECKSKLLSLRVREAIYNGHNPQKNRGRGKLSWLEKSFKDWLDENYPNIEYIMNKKIIRLDSIHSYFIDFYFPALQLGIELDGSQHKQTVEYDSIRDSYITTTYGIKMIRITYDEYKKRTRINEVISLLTTCSTN